MEVYGFSVTLIKIRNGTDERVKQAVSQKMKHSGLLDCRDTGRLTLRDVWISRC